MAWLKAKQPDIHTYLNEVEAEEANGRCEVGKRVLFSFLGRSFFPFTAGGRVATARPPAHDLSLTSGRALLQLSDGYPAPTDRSMPASEPVAEWAVSGACLASLGVPSTADRRPIRRGDRCSGGGIPKAPASAQDRPRLG